MLPVLTSEQRQAGLSKAWAARALRAQLLDQIRRGELTLTDVFSQVDQDAAGVAAKTRLGVLLKSLPGGDADLVAQLLAKLGVAEELRIGRLGSHQRLGVLGIVQTWQNSPASP